MINFPNYNNYTLFVTHCTSGTFESQDSMQAILSGSPLAITNCTDQVVEVAGN